MSTTASAPTATIAGVGTWPVDGLDGLEGRYLTVELPPGLRAPLHHHDGWQFVYVLEGTVISQMEGDPATRYEQGAAWYEARGHPHVVFANETDRPAKVLVFYLTEPNRPVLIFDD